MSPLVDGTPGRRFPVLRILAVLALAFLVYSHTVSERRVRGTVDGFQNGTSKLECFRHYLRMQQAGEVNALTLADAASGAEPPIDGLLSEEDFGRERQPGDASLRRTPATSDEWQVRLVTGVQTIDSLFLHFQDGRLASVTGQDSPPRRPAPRGKP